MNANSTHHRRQGDAGGSQTPPHTQEAVSSAVAFILRSTGQRPQTEAELTAKLEARDYPADVTEAALAQAREFGAVDDAAFAHAWVDDRGRNRGYGVARLRRELQRRRVPDPLIEEALAALDDRDELAAALELARAKAQRLPATIEPRAAARRVHAFLVRRGYGDALAQRAAITATGLDRVWD